MRWRFVEDSWPWSSASLGSHWVLGVIILALMMPLGAAFLSFGGRSLQHIVKGRSGSARALSAATQAAANAVIPTPAALASFDKVFSGPDKRPVVLFDGVCNFCNAGVNTVLRLDKDRKLRFAPLQSQVGRELMEACGRSSEDLSSMVVIEPTKQLYLKSDAAIRIAEITTPNPTVGRMLQKATSTLIPRFVRDRAYDTVATNRYSILGKRDQCRVPEPEDYDRFLA